MKMKRIESYVSEHYAQKFLLIMNRRFRLISRPFSKIIGQGFPVQSHVVVKQKIYSSVSQLKTLRQYLEWYQTNLRPPSLRYPPVLPEEEFVFNLVFSLNQKNQ